MADELLRLNVSLNLDTAQYLAGVSTANAGARQVGNTMQRAGLKGSVALTGAGKAVNRVLLPALIKGHLISQTLALSFRALSKLVRGFVSAVAPLPPMLEDIASSFTAKGFIQKSSDFTEFFSKFKIVFKEFSGEAQAFARDFGDTVGRDRKSVV